MSRQAIVDAAARLFRAKGYRATTMADIGAAVGLLRGSLYYYVASKQQLLYGIFEAGTHGLLSGLQEITRAAAPPDERLRDAILNHVRFVAERSDYAAVFLGEIQHLHDSSLRRSLQRLMRNYEQVFARLIEDGIAAGTFRKPLDVRVIVFGILGMDNWVLRWFRPDGGLPIERIALEFADLVIEGLRAREG